MLPYTWRPARLASRFDAATRPGCGKAFAQSHWKMASKHRTRAGSSSHRVKRPHRFLLVDDDPLMLRSMGRLLRKAHPDWEISTAESGEEALSELSSQTYDVLVTDMQMPNMDGIELLSLVSSRHPEIACVIHSSQIESLTNERIRRVARAVVQKGADAEELVGTLDWALKLAIANRTDPQSGAG
jgi:DNA-binding NtrC family response regulator